jgi:hypothetical protein
MSDNKARDDAFRYSSLDRLAMPACVDRTRDSNVQLSAPFDRRRRPRFSLH